MSSCIRTYIVDQAALCAVAGSNDSGLLAQMVAAGADHLISVPQELSRHEVLNTLIGRPPLRRALKQLFSGRRSSSPAGEYHLCAYELACSHFAISAFDQWSHVSRAASWIDAIQRACQDVSAELDLLQLLYRGGLIDLPADALEEGGCGYWPHDQVQRYKAELDRYLASEICETPEDPMHPLNYPLHDLAKWVDAAAAREGAAVVSIMV